MCESAGRGGGAAGATLATRSQELGNGATERRLTRSALRTTRLCSYNRPVHTHKAGARSVAWMRSYLHL